MASAKTNARTEQMIAEALEKALCSDGACRLVARGKKRGGLFPGETAKCKAVIDRCLDSSSPLLRVEREETERSGPNELAVRYVSLTPEGVVHLLAKRTPDEARALVANARLPEATMQEVLRDDRLPLEIASMLVNRQVEVATEQIRLIEAEWERVLRVNQEIFDGLSNLLGNFGNRIEETTARLQGQLAELRGRINQVQGARAAEPVGYEVPEEVPVGG